jgi:hypothetical protein
MTIRQVLSTALVFLLPGAALCFEHATHHGITTAARHFVINAHLADSEFEQFLEDPNQRGFGSFIDTRAGDEHPVDNKDHKISWTDEDRTDGATATSDRGRG